MRCGSVWPSPSTISRARLCLDVAWMLRVSDVHTSAVQHNGALFPVFDSSPQGGRNWCLMEHSHLRSDRLECMRASSCTANGPVGRLRHIARRLGRADATISY
ncbi:unnamed protein product [Prorocentrum cordatum]|uniref:Uncharacterized protein n=1 Tax=Prorocentrum cordatum TaxID=2364126 RepID=A0ABN9WYB3_9DINO|nr:unnamed protein product [Polarella glacialis]